MSYQIQASDGNGGWRVLKTCHDWEDGVILSDEYAYHHEVWCRIVDVSQPDVLTVVFTSSPLT